MNNREITKVYLLSVPLESDLKHTLFFSDRGSQESYFTSKIKKSYTNFSYQRKDNVISVPDHYDNIYNCNYVMYQNSNVSDKWYYAFIKNMRYENGGTTYIEIETDVIQTWMFDYTIKPSFVEREHIKDDTIGKHTVPEGLETGEYICNELVRDNELSDLVYVIMVTEYTNSTDEAPNKPLAVNFGGIFAGYGAYICSTMNEVVNIIQAFGEGKAEAVVGVYMIPKKIIKEDEDDGTLQFAGQSKPVTYDISIEKQTTLDSYKPRNNKLLTFPYQYILNSNNAGSSNILQYELFGGNACNFEVAGIPTVGGSIKCVPKYYKGLERIQEEGIMLGKFPTLSWSQDLYTNWLTQNALNLNVGVATGGLSVLGGIGMAFVNPVVGVGMIAGGIGSVYNVMQQVHQHSFTPNSAKGNVNGGDINTAYDMNKFYFYKMSIKSEYAKKIDAYLDAYGYKVNDYKTPYKNHRKRYWYTKTIDVNIDGNIPGNDMQKIKECYDKGITFWKNPSEIGVYSDEEGYNAIV